MTRVKLIQELKKFCEDAIKNNSLPEAVQKGDTKEKSRIPGVYLMRLPDSASTSKLAPYIIVQFINSKHGRSDGSLPNPSYTAATSPRGTARRSGQTRRISADL